MKKKEFLYNPLSHFTDYPQANFFDDTILKRWTGPARKVEFVDGKATLTPDKGLIAGSIYTFTVKFKAGREGINEGGRIIFSFPITWTKPVLQGDVPGRVSLHKKESCELTAELKQDDGVEYYIVIKIVKGKLSPGEEISFEYKNVQIQKFPQSTWDNLRNNLRIYVGEKDGKLRVLRRESSYSPEIISGPPQKIQVTIPAISHKGEKISAKCVLLDQNNNLARPKWEGKAWLSSQSDPYKPDKIIDLNKEKSNIFKFDNIQPSKSGVVRLPVRISNGHLYGLSNPCLVEDNPEPFNLYFGDIHGHTVRSDGLGTPDDYYKHAKYVASADFGAVMDHNHWEVSRSEGPFYKRMPQEIFDDIQEAGDRWNSPGEFVTLIGLEMTYFKDYVGHMNIYYRGSGYPVCYAETTEELWEFLKDKEALVIPHHTIWGGKSKNLSKMNPEYIKVIEVYSMHGSSEYGENPIFRDISEESFGLRECLNAGWRFGVIASSDNHNGAPFLSPVPSRFRIITYPGGIAGVYAKKLTREDIFDAIKRRRCYGTTGARIILKFNINNQIMGSEISLTGNEPRRITGMVCGTDRIASVEIYRSGKLFKAYYPEGEVLEFDEFDREEFTGSLWYYARVKQFDGNMAWSSPIWVDKRKEK